MPITLPIDSIIGEGYSSLMTKTLTAQDIVPIHGVRDTDKLAALIADMQVNGWVGAPIVMLDSYQALTGSHRLAAAEATDTDIPTVALDDLLAEHGQPSLDELAQEYCLDEYEVLIRLCYHLPADVIAAYGIDIH